MYAQPTEVSIPYFNPDWGLVALDRDAGNATKNSSV